MRPQMRQQKTAGRRQKSGLLLLLFLSLLSCTLHPSLLPFLPATAQTTQNRKAEADRLLQQGIQKIESREPEAALKMLEQALQIYQAMKDRSGEGKALANLGRAYFAFQSYAKAIAYSEQSLAIAQSIKDQQLEVAVLKRLGLVYSLTDNHPKAVAAVAQYLAIHRKNNDRAEEVRALGDLGFVYLRANDFAKATEVQEQAVQLAEQLNDNSLIFEARGNLTQTSIVLRGKAFELWQRGIQQEQANQFEAAIQSWERALQIYRVMQSRSYELPQDRLSAEDVLTRLGSTYYRLGNYPKAREYQEIRLAFARESGRASDTRILEGQPGRSLTYTDLALSNYSKASAQIEQQLAIARDNGNILEEAKALNNLGHLYSALGSYAKAIEYYEKGLAIIQKFNDRLQEAVVLSYLGDAYYSLGDYTKAISYYTQGLPTHKGPKLRGADQLHANMLNNLGHSYFKLGNYKISIDYYEQSLAIYRRINDPEGDAGVLGYLSNVYSTLRNQAKAIELGEQSLSIYRAIKDRAGEGGTLSRIGSIYENFGNYSKAIDYYQQSLAISREIKAKESERKDLAEIGSALKKQNQVELAIIFYKQSVNVSETIREDTRSLPRDLQVTYTATVAETYRELANLLLQQNRIIEAMQVLDLLKVQDLQDFLKDFRGNAFTQKGAELLPQEVAILQTLQTAPRQLSQTIFQSSGIQAQVQSLRQTAVEQNLKLKSYQDLQIRVNKLGKNIALFYPLVLDDRLELVVLANDRPPIRKPVAISAKLLETEIQTFRQQLERRSPLIQESAQKLYQSLFQPLESELKAAGVDTIVYAPDSFMRYVPLAALYDGNQWLAQRYQINYLTALALTPLEAEQNSNSRVLAAALTQPRQITLLGKTYTFPALQFTQPEVKNLAQLLPNTTTLIDQAFNRVNLNKNVSQSTILHLATHGMFIPGSPDQSIILLGDGSSISLREIEQQWQFPNLSLVVLSACETAIGGKLGNGIEILGFGYQMQRVGARATLSSLWRVDDGGTQVLMTAFYHALKQGMTKAQALQEAQKALITGNYSTVGGRRSDIEVGVDSQTGQARTLEVDRLSHPYYWSSFILIGNGL